jgi:hypothetical protein
MYRRRGPSLGDRDQRDDSLTRHSFTYDAYDVPSLEATIQARGGPQVDLTGTVDSGASSTVLSRGDAEELGLGAADLREAGPVVVADGSEVRCWTSAPPIREQVLRTTSTGVVRPWGPVFDLDAIFLEHASPLWGQSDFFDTFGIDFQRPMFTLRY